MNRLITQNTSYAGFNLLLLSPTRQTSENDLSLDAVYVTNSGGGGRITSRSLTTSERQCGGLSNGVEGHGANEWPKVVQGTNAFKDILQTISSDTPEDEVAEALFGLLAWVHPFTPVCSFRSCI